MVKVMLNVVVADDEIPAVEELAYLLSNDERIGTIHRAISGAEALRALEENDVDALFLDIHMPTLSGLDIARVISRFTRPPAVVFVTADEDLALDAFDLAAVDYLLKPLRPERLSETVRRIEQLSEDDGEDGKSSTITVDQGGLSRMIRLDEIRYVQAQGDYARLYTAESSYLVRVPLTDLQQQWSQLDFVRIHRSYLVSMDYVTSVKLSASRANVTVDETQLPVSRRHLPALRSMLESNRIRPQV